MAQNLLLLFKCEWVNLYYPMKASESSSVDLVTDW